MRVTGLNHFNIATDDLEASAAFYEKLGLVRGPRPDFGNTGVWLYIEGKPKVHLNLESEVGPIVQGTGVVHHLGFDVRGSIEDICGELDRLGVEWRLWPAKVPGWYRALYFKGPSGEEIEFVLIDNLVPKVAASEAVAA